jgi:hypothetical protein
VSGQEAEAEEEEKIRLNQYVSLRSNGRHKYYIFCLSSFCFLCPMLSVSLDCSFLIVPSVFSDVYLQRINAKIDETILMNVKHIDS